MKRRGWITVKLVLISSGFLGLTIVTALCVRDWTTESTKLRGPASAESHSVFEHRGNLSASELGMLGSTVLNRGRRVVFHETEFRRESSYGRNFTVPINLYPDLTLNVQFQKPSAYNVNQDIFVGQVEGDTDSSVRFVIVGHVLDGTIETLGRQYRIIDGGNGLLIVTESPAK